MNAMTPIDAKAHALALYETACESHRRQDWRMSAHALAAVLKALDIPERIQQAAEPAKPAAIAPKAPKAAKPAKASKVAAYSMTAESLTRALRLLGRAVEARNSTPILSTVHMRAAHSYLAITSTNLDFKVSVRVEGEGLGQWEAAVPYAKLRDVLAKMSGPVTMTGERSEVKTRKVNQETEEYRDSSVKVSAGSASAILAGLCPEDFPMGKFEANYQVPITASQLGDALQFVRLSISTEETRYYLGGVYLHSSTQGTHVAATDGHRLACVTTAPQETAPTFGGVIIPRDTVLAILACIKAGVDGALHVSPSGVSFESPEVCLQSKTIDGSFPDYTRVIPETSDTPVSLDGAGLSAMVARVSSVSDAKAPPVNLAFADGYLTATCQPLDGAASSESMGYGCTGAYDVSMSVNANYLRQACDELGDVVEFHLGGSNDPIRLANPAKPDRLMVLMPLRV